MNIERLSLDQLREADRIVGFDEDHDSVLASPAVFDRLSAELAAGCDRCANVPVAGRSASRRGPSPDTM
jgi:hypothetical protein